MRLALLTVGDELLLGDLPNTNAAWLGRALAGVGGRVVLGLTVPDEVAAIVAALGAALAAADGVVVTGGLGPTPDDLTWAALTRLAGAPLPVRGAAPPGAAWIPNPVGAVHGVRLTVGGRPVWAVPGVPAEMAAMVTAAVLPEVRAASGAVVSTRTLRVALLGEAAVARRLAADRGFRVPDGVRLAFLPGPGETQVRLTASGVDPAAVDRWLAPVLAAARTALGPAVYAEGERSLAEVVHAALRGQGASLASAESFTGGMLGAALTDPPGASGTYRGGVTAYASEAKVRLLGVPAALLARTGAVHPDVAAAMAAAVRDRLEATYGVATTGVAGPGAQDGRPPGTVFVAVAGPGGVTAAGPRLAGSRAHIRAVGTVWALDLLRRVLAGHPPPGAD